MATGPTILVLDDGSTYAGDGSVWELTEDGYDRLIENGDDPDHLASHHVRRKVPLADLLAAYNKVHGTNL